MAVKRTLRKGARQELQPGNGVPKTRILYAAAVLKDEQGALVFDQASTGQLAPAAIRHAHGQTWYELCHSHTHGTHFCWYVGQVSIFNRRNTPPLLNCRLASCQKI